MKNKILSILLVIVMIFSLFTMTSCDISYFVEGLQGADGADGIDGIDGEDGIDGKDGVDGKDGKDGADGITPLLRINEETNYWEVSYDNGLTWTSMGVKATGEGSNDLNYDTKNPNNWIRQTISPTGVISQPGTTTYDRSQIMYAHKFDYKIEFVPTGNIYFGFVTYDELGNFESRVAWYTEADGTQIFSDDNPFNVIIAAKEIDSSIPVEEMLDRFTIEKVDESKLENSEAVEKLQAQIDYLNFIQSCETSEKIVHFSCDDTYACLYDLIKNQDNYTSIFENNFFANLRACHEATGACFTLNTFNTVTTIPDYDISNVPTKFQSEFQTNKSWLRFAFHAENETTKYATAKGALESYEKFVSAIYQLTGDYECIDRIARLGFFSGSLENILQLKEADYGIIGLLTADDTRTSYYLTHKQSEIVRLKGKYCDLENELILIKSLSRNPSIAKEELDSNPLYRKTTEFFWHENENISSVMNWVTAMAQYCNEQGYIHGFPSDLYQPIE